MNDDHFAQPASPWHCSSVVQANSERMARWLYQHGESLKILRFNNNHDEMLMATVLEISSIDCLFSTLSWRQLRLLLTLISLYWGSMMYGRTRPYSVFRNPPNSWMTETFPVRDHPRALARYHTNATWMSLARVQLLPSNLNCEGSFFSATVLSIFISGKYRF